MGLMRVTACRMESVVLTSYFKMTTFDHIGEVITVANRHFTLIIVNKFF